MFGTVREQPGRTVATGSLGYLWKKNLIAHSLAAFGVFTHNQMRPLHMCCQDDLPQWAGSSLYDALTAQQQQQHQKVLHDVLCLVHQPGCFTSGLGLEAWQYENVASSTAKIHFASHRLEGMYSYMGGARWAYSG